MGESEEVVVRCTHRERLDPDNDIEDDFPRGAQCEAEATHRTCDNDAAAAAVCAAHKCRCNLPLVKPPPILRAGRDEELVALRTEVDALRAQLAEAREANTKLHRRVQVDEGDVARAALLSTRDRWRREIANARMYRVKVVGRVVGRLRDVCKLLMFYGASDAYIRADGSPGRHRYECFMIADLAAQRDAAEAKLALAERVAEAVRPYIEDIGDPTLRPLFDAFDAARGGAP